MPGTSTLQVFDAVYDEVRGKSFGKPISLPALADGLAIADGWLEASWPSCRIERRVAVRERLDFADAIDGHDYAPVNADEPVGVEPAVETRERLAKRCERPSTCSAR